MSQVGPRRTGWARRQLTAVANATTLEAADRRLYRFSRWAAQSTQNMDTAFRAVQTLRDLETIDRAEAAYLFNEFIQALLWKELSDGCGTRENPELVQAIDAGIEFDLITAAISDRETVRVAAMHRERGEEELAHMLLRCPDDYSDLRTEGEMSLVRDKPSTEHPVPGRARPDTPPPLSEHVLALSAAQNFKEWMAAWPSFCESMKGTDPATAVATAQRLREVGSISFNESLIMIDMAIDDLVDRALEADREHQRLAHAIEVFERDHDIKPGDGALTASLPLPWQVLTYRWNRRIDGIKAGILRRFGEHRLASLQATRPEEYQRIRDHESIGLTAAG